MNRPLLSKEFAVDALERALKTFAQALLAVFGATTFNWWEAKWNETLASAGIAAAVSVLTSIMSAGVSSNVSPASAVPTPPVDVDDDRGDISLYTVVAVLVGICAVVWLIDRF